MRQKRQSFSFPGIPGDSILNESSHTAPKAGHGSSGQDCLLTLTATAEVCDPLVNSITNSRQSEESEEIAEDWPKIVPASLDASATVTTGSAAEMTCCARAKNISR